MARFYPSGGTGGGGLDTSKLTAYPEHILEGYIGGIKDYDEPYAGTMPNKVINSGGWWTARDAGYNGNDDNNAGGLYAYIRDRGYYDDSIGIRIPRSLVADRLGISSGLIRKGYTIAGVAGDAWVEWTGGASAVDGHVLKGETFWREGVKHTGTMTVSSVVSFSVAPYSTSQVIATWKNPSKGPYSTFIVCAKTGGYPANNNDSRVYVGGGNNGALNATNSITIGGLAAGQLYYFRIWVSVNTSAGWIASSGYLQTTCTPTAHGRASFTASGTFTVPNGVRAINIHTTGAGSGGKPGAHGGLNRGNAGGGGGGGCTSYKTGISVSPGNKLDIVVGAGLDWRVTDTSGGPYSGGEEIGASSATLNGSILVKALGAHGGKNWTQTGTRYYPAYGASDGGEGAQGGYNGGWGGSPSPGQSNGGGEQQATTTREFGNGTIYSGGGGGGGVDVYHSGSESHVIKPGQAGGEGGGGQGGNGRNSENDPDGLGRDASFGTGSGGGGGSYSGQERTARSGGAGSGGNVIITW